jgi:hypothetical protein
MKFSSYSADRIESLPPKMREAIGENFCCCFLSRLLERLGRSAIEQALS